MTVSIFCEKKKDAAPIRYGFNKYRLTIDGLDDAKLVFYELLI